MKHRTFNISGERVDVSWTETDGTVEANVSGRKYTIEKKHLPNGAFWFGESGQSAEVSVSPTDTGFDVTVRSHRIAVDFVDSLRKVRRQDAAGEGIVAVRAPMPGKIVKVLAAPGSDVEAHQGIVVMEAMKMQNEIRAPRKGKLIALKVVEGDHVKSGDLIANID